MDPDFALLRQYVTESSEAAFRELVKNQVGLVYQTALRLAGGDHAMAHDAAQLVFTDLARKAASLPPGTIMAGWLHRHTGFVTAKLIRTEQRRRLREQKYPVMMEDNSSTPESEALWQQLAPVLDEALGRLPVADRDALVLRFLEGCGLREVGSRLGLTENTARMRVTRALEKMRLILQRRGITSTSLVLGSALILARSAEAPAGLAQTVTATALQTAPASAALGVASLAWWVKPVIGLGLTAVTVIPVRHLMMEKPVVPPLVKLDQAPPDSLSHYRPEQVSLQPAPPSPPASAAAAPGLAASPAKIGPVQTTAMVTPVAQSGETARLVLEVVPGVMRFTPEKLSVKAGQPVIIQFRNDKCPLQHNFLLVKPGKLEEIGALADRLLTDPQAMAKHYLPASPEILATSHHLVGPGQSDLIEFTAPMEPGEYPFLCTFPGHWRLMHGMLLVVP
jgi:RNA polymerase sigma factor (sigma-70 family)